MASAEDCEAALTKISQRLAEVPPQTRSKHSLDRVVTIHVNDLDLTWSGRLHDGLLTDVTPGGNEPGQIRLRTASDDLVRLAEGSLNIASAWASGRLRIEAPPLDLLRLGTLL
jgi:hypothetical protein